MKSLLAPILLTMSLNSNLIAPNFDSVVYYVNSNNVEMTEVNYNKLIQLGYTKRELEFLTLDEYIEKSGFIVKNTIVDTYVQKTTINEMGTPNSTKQIISKQQALLEMEQKNNIHTRTATESSNYVDEYKEFSFFGSTIIDSDGNKKYFVKVNMDWLITPEQRYTDIIALIISDAVQIESQNSNIIFDSSFIYTKYTSSYYSTSLGVIQNEADTSDYIIRVDNLDTNDYEYIVTEGLTVQYDLPPLDSHVQENGSNYYYEYHEIYSNFSFSLSACFYPTSTTVISAPFAGAYFHSRIGLGINMEGIQLSLFSPFIEFPFGLNIINYSETIGSYFLLNDADINWPIC